MSPQEKIQELTAELKQHNYNYYVLAQPTISDKEFDMQLKELEKLDSFKPDLIVNLYPTSPFRKPTSIDNAIQQMMQDPSYDSLRSLTKCTEHPYKMWEQKNNEIDFLMAETIIQSSII